MRAVELAAVRHGVARIDREIDHDLFELRQVDLDRPQVSGKSRINVTRSPIRRRSSIVRSLRVSYRSSACGRKVCLRRDAQQLPHQSRGASRVLLHLDDVLERGIVGLCAFQEEVGRHHDGGQRVVEVVRDAAGQYPTDSIFCC